MNNAEQDLRIIGLERRVTHLSQSLSATDRLSERLLRRLMILEYRTRILEGNVDPVAPDYAAPGQDDYSKLDWGEDPREMEPDYAKPAAKWRDWANELEAVSWYDATLVRKVGKYYYGADSHPATLNALRQLQEKYPDNELLAALAAEPEQVLASLIDRQSTGI